jgi:1,4-alpha-glucan branching enzyme
MSTPSCGLHQAPPLPRYSAKRSRQPVNFFCLAPDATQVSLVGASNDWQAIAHPMERMPEGYWMTRAELTRGHHQYCFLVDGRPVLDLRASGRALNYLNEPVSLIAIS